MDTRYSSTYLVRGICLSNVYQLVKKPNRLVHERRQERPSVLFSASVSEWRGGCSFWFSWARSSYIPASVAVPLHLRAVRTRAFSRYLPWSRFILCNFSFLIATFHIFLDFNSQVQVPKVAANDSMVSDNTGFGTVSVHALIKYLFCAWENLWEPILSAAYKPVIWPCHGKAIQVLPLAINYKQWRHSRWSYSPQTFPKRYYLSTSFSGPNMYSLYIVTSSS